MTHAERVYRDAWNEWQKAQTEYKRKLNQIALHQREANDPDQNWEGKVTAAFNAYHKVASKYRNALESYAQVRPEMRGRLGHELARGAEEAQMAGKERVAEKYLGSLSDFSIENAKIAHKDWVENQDQEHFAAVFLAISDAQVMGADEDADVTAIYDEMLDLFEQGKVKRDKQPAPAVNNAPKVPSVKKPSPVKKPRRRIPTVRQILPWGPQ